MENHTDEVMMPGSEAQPQLPPETGATRSKTWISLIIIVLVALVIINIFIGVAVVNKKIAENPQVATTVLPTTLRVSPTPSELPIVKSEVLGINDDTVVASIQGENYAPGFYKIDIASGAVTPFITINKQIESFSGLHLQEKTSTTYRGVAFYVANHDKSKVLVEVGTYNSADEFGAYGPTAIKKEEYLCIVATKQCSPSTILQEADATMKAAGITTGSQTVLGTWEQWDEKRNLLLGHRHGEGGSISPLIALNIQTKKFQTTEAVDKTLALEFWNVKYSPSLQRVLVTELGNSNISHEARLAIYDTNNFNNSPEVFDISAVRQIMDKESVTETIEDIYWTPNEQGIVMTTATRMYYLDTNLGQVKLVTDAQKHLLPNNLNQLRFSRSGRYAYFIDYQPSPQQSVLKKIDLSQNGVVTEVLQTTSIDIIQDLADHSSI